MMLGGDLKKRKDSLKSQNIIKRKRINGRSINTIQEDMNLSTSK